MNDVSPIRILLVEDNSVFAELLQLHLKKHDGARFSVVWKGTGQAAIEELEGDKGYDLVLMDYFLPGMNGVEVTRTLREKGIIIPIVFLTVNTEFDLVVEAMRLGIDDYLLKDEVSTPAFPRTLLEVVERMKLRDRLSMLEVSQKRMEAIREIVVRISHDLRGPLDALRNEVAELLTRHQNDRMTPYLTIMRDNIARIEARIEKLKSLKGDETVTYVDDIKMLDLS